MDTTPHFRRTTAFYEVVILTSPARIESLAIDPAGRGRHLGVINNFGHQGSAVFASYGAFSESVPSSVVAGRPERVVEDGSSLRLERLPVGDRGLYANWTFRFAERTFDVALEWVIERPQADLWEAGWKLDAAARHGGVFGVGDQGDPDVASAGTFHDADGAALAWWDDDPRYEHTLVAAFVPGSADRGDRLTVEAAHDRPVMVGSWSTVRVTGGTDLPVGVLAGGRWRIGASGQAMDDSYVGALVEEVGGGVPAAAASGVTPMSSQRPAALSFGASLGRPRAVDGPVRRVSGGAWLLTDGRVLAAFVRGPESWSVWLYVAAGERWQLAAAAASSMQVSAIEPDGDGLRVRGTLRGADGRVEATTAQSWRLAEDYSGLDDHGDPASVSGAIRVSSLDTPVAGHRGHPMHAFLAYPGGLSNDDIDRYDVLGSPVLRPRADFVAGQRALWSPAVQVQHGAASIALIPDLLEHRRPGSHGDMAASRYFGLALDLDVADRTADAPQLRCGWKVTEAAFGYYYRDAGRTPAQPVVVAYDLVLRSGAPERSVTSDVVHRLWSRVGRRHATRSLLPQTQPADAAFDESWSSWGPTYESRRVGDRLLGAVRMEREVDISPGVNFTSWFNALRTSYGLYTHGRDRGDVDLMAKGRSTLDLLLAAPTEAGAFPTIAGFTADGFTWQASHRNFLDQMPWGPTAYSTFDMGWAAYWVLRWHQDLVDEPRALRFARDYAGFVIGRQLPSGAVPSWVATGTFEVDPHLRESAQTASSVMLLAEFAKVTGEPRYLDAAERAARYVVEHHLDRQRWDDFEPYYSNTLKSEGAACPFSGQHTQNTLSMHFAAIGLLTLHQMTGRVAWLEAGVRAVDTHLQYQYVSPGLGLSVNCFGGFAVQNTDNEALDARQSQFGVTLLDYARETGRADYAERGIAALRAGYATMASPSAEIVNPKYFDAHPVGRGPENYAHATFDTPAEYTTYDWGQGSAMAGFAEARNRFGDVWVDVRRGVAYGIDFVHVDEFRVEDGTWHLELSSPSPGHRVLVKADGLVAGEVKLAANGEPPRPVTRDALSEGVTVPTRQRLQIVHNPHRQEDPVSGRPFVVRSTISHGDPVARAHLHYRLPGAHWAEAPLTAAAAGTWVGEIPAGSLRPGQEIHYYFSASTGHETRTAPEVDPEQVPYVRRI